MEPTESPRGLRYEDAGVDIAAGNALVEAIKPIAKQTHRPGVLTGIGGFASLFELPVHDYQQPVLVSATDGVGTKLKLAIEHQQHTGIGIDLVAMCANDLITCGADPLYFLDYYATAKLDVEVAKQVINSIAVGCELADMSLLGGETAEMPGMYQSHDYDLAGFCVGAVDKPYIIDGSQVSAGDKLIALASSGPHANGYSLIRRILDKVQADQHELLAGIPLQQWLLEPTKLYVRAVKQLRQHLTPHAMAHITGGGLTENLPRVLPEGLGATIHTASWQWPAIFTWLAEKGEVDAAEMYRTFNCGIGFVLVIAANEADLALEILQRFGENAWLCGEVIADAEQQVHFQ